MLSEYLNKNSLTRTSTL